MVFVESHSAGFRVQIYAQNRVADLTQHTGKNEKQMKEIFSTTYSHS